MKNKLDTAIEIGATLALGYVITRFIRIGITKGESMLPTFKSYRPIILDPGCYRRREPRRHDIVAFKCQRKTLLKRVIALAGEHILIEDGCVYINGERLDEPYLKEEMKASRKIAMRVAAGTLFVLGDNRNHSLDSRKLGLIPVKDVRGVVKGWK